VNLLPKPKELMGSHSRHKRKKLLIGKLGATRKIRISIP
jgi:hypothetical protein